jgi:hypothetical protein
MPSVAKNHAVLFLLYIMIIGQIAFASIDVIGCNQNCFGDDLKRTAILLVEITPRKSEKQR